MTNPYQPPESPLEPDGLSRWFRWRLIPAVVLTCFGTMLLISAALMFLWSLAHSTDVPRLLGSSGSVGGLLIGAAGGSWIASGLGFWGQKWWRAIACLVVGYAAGVLGSALMQPHHPAGSASTPPEVQPRPAPGALKPDR